MTDTYADAELLGVLADLATVEEHVAALRILRREIVKTMQAEGRTLAEIGALAGRSKQIVAQWANYQT